MRRYAKTHEWFEDLGDGRVRVGISEHAAKQLSDIVFVELPAAGKAFQTGESACVLESVKAVADVYVPAGRVAEVNETLKEHPGLINQDPEGKGWILILEGVSEEALKGYLSKEEYEAGLA